MPLYRSLAQRHEAVRAERDVLREQLGRYRQALIDSGVRRCTLGACGEGIVDECYHSPKGIAWVRQEHPDGCGVAALAMLTGQTYEQVNADLLADPWNGEYVRTGGNSSITQLHLEKYLANRGWFFRRVYDKWQLGDGEWPPCPFAERHYAIVANPGGGHFVVMDRHGLVLDPLREGNYRLRDWDVVNVVVGLTQDSLLGAPVGQVEPPSRGQSE